MLQFEKCPQCGNRLTVLEGAPDENQIPLPSTGPNPRFGVHATFLPDEPVIFMTHPCPGMAQRIETQQEVPVSKSETPQASYTFQYLNGQSAPFKTLDASDDSDFWNNVLPTWEAETGHKALRENVVCHTRPRKVPAPVQEAAKALERARRAPVHQQVPGFAPPAQ